MVAPRALLLIHSQLTPPGRRQALRQSAMGKKVAAKIRKAEGKKYATMRGVREAPKLLEPRLESQHLECESPEPLNLWAA